MRDEADIAHDYLRQMAVDGYSVHYYPSHIEGHYISRVEKDGVQSTARGNLAPIEDGWLEGSKNHIKRKMSGIHPGLFAGNPLGINIDCEDLEWPWVRKNDDIIELNGVKYMRIEE